jgi:vitamin B12 transporter
VAVNRKYLGGRGNVLLACNYVGPREDSTTSGRLVLAEYWLASAATTVDLTDHWQLVARLDNILNEDYEEVYGYGTAKTSIFGGFSGHW